MRKISAKPGAIYNDWRIVSADETADKHGHFWVEVACTDCGTHKRGEFFRVRYDTIAPCQTCRKVIIEARREAAKDRLRFIREAARRAKDEIIAKQREEYRRLRGLGYSMKAIADQTGGHASAVCRILRGGRH